MDIIVIVGPTAVGKTKLSIALAKRFHGEIINADSMQVYQELNIGTAKIKEEEKEGIVHHLFDFVPVDAMYTVYDYQRDCRVCIEDILSRGKTPILVGGTGLYIKAALYQYEFDEDKESYDFSSFSSQELYQKVMELDPTCVIHPNNRQRLERYLFQLQKGRKKANKKDVPLYSFRIIGLTMPRDELYLRINDRVDEMFQEGLVEEVRSLYERGVRSKAVLTGIGYKEIYRYFDGLCRMEDAILEVKKNSRHYAKRQYTFFRNQMDVTWFSVHPNCFSETIQEIIFSLQK